MNRRVILMALVLLFVMPFVTVQACGPDFFPDVFVRRIRPDNPKEFAAGKLGVLLPSYPRADLVVAYRYLKGGALTAAEQTGYTPTESLYTEEEESEKWQQEEEERKNAVTPAMQWQKARAKYAEAKEAPEQMRSRTVQGNYQGSVFEDRYADCGDDALLHATKVLEERAKNWGARSPELLDWIHAQDAVFAGCSGANAAPPADAPASASLLLRQDRAYQKAAALFYRESFDDAIQAFEEIGRDKLSPWHGLARYLATRAMVCKAFLSAKPDDKQDMATFDPAMMKQAQSAIEAMLREPGGDLPRGALRKELDLVRLRTEPMVQVRYLSAALEGPKTDANYAQHLADLTWYLNVKLDSRAVRGDADVGAILGNDAEWRNAKLTEKLMSEKFSTTYRDLSELRSASTLVDWLITFQSPAEEAHKHAIAEWKKTGQLSWLVAALTKASIHDPEATELVQAAGQVAPGSPAWEMTNYHRARLLIGLGRAAGARTLLGESMAKVQDGKRDSSLNLYQGLRMRAAPTLDEALTFAPRKILNRVSEEQSSLDECLDVMKNPRRKYDCKKAEGTAEFSSDAASLFNLETPLSVLAEAANSNRLPENLRRSLAMMAWVRSVLAKDDVTAAKVFSLLPVKIQEQAGVGTGFRPTVALVRNPGLRPYLDPGVQRSYSFDFIESYRDNWWCKDWGLNEWQNYWQQRGFPNQSLTQVEEAPTFLTAEQRNEGERQSAQLRSMDDADVVLGQRVLAYAKDHPQDSDVPESLYLVLRMVRYSCGPDEPEGADQKRMIRLTDEVREGAARILRQRYTASPWTKKAAPYVR